MINFLMGWFMIGFYTWVFMMVVVILIYFIARFGKSIGSKTLCEKARKTLYTIGTPLQIVVCTMLGPLFTIALIGIIIEVIAGE